jgi:TrmH family RNA methyltransferase
VVGVFPQAFVALGDVSPGLAQCVVALHRVRDPGNLGTIVRTADGAGCGAVVLVGECCDPYSVEAVRATMGSIFAVPLAKATEAEFAAWRKGWTGSVVGTLLSADVTHSEAEYRKPALVLMGNEQQGLTPDMAALCDVNVKIPMRGRADSLNLSVATGVMIYAATA